MANNQQSLWSHRRAHLLASILFIVAIIGILSACKPNTSFVPSTIPTPGPVTPTPDPGISMARPVISTPTVGAITPTPTSKPVTSPPPLGQVTPTPTPEPPPMLVASPSRFNANADCRYNMNRGWRCVATLSNLKNAQAPLDWYATSSGIDGITFVPSSGTLLPGQRMRVTIRILNTVCPAQANFRFTGPGNVQDVSWNCATPGLSVSPATLSNGCVSCVVTLGLASGAQGEANWSASTTNIQGVTFSPPQGVLRAGHSVQVAITVPGTACPPSAQFSFTGPKNTTQVMWTCLPAQLAVSSTNLNFGTLQPGIAATQTVQISNSGSRALTWTANKGKTNWLTLSKSDSVLAPGSSTTLHITVNPKGMKAGNHSTTVSITSNGGDVQVVVVLTVSDAPGKLTVNSIGLTFSNIQQNTTSTRTLKVRYSGKHAVTWTAQTSKARWLSIDNAGSTISPDGSATIDVTVKTAHLRVGHTYSATITIRSNEGVSVQVPVCLTLATSSHSQIGHPSSTLDCDRKV